MEFSQWQSTFFAFSLIIEGATEKVLQFLMLIMSIFNQNLGFIELCVFLNTTEWPKQYIKPLTLIWSWIYFSDDLLRAALYRLMLVLNKDVLFHWDLVARNLVTGYKKVFLLRVKQVYYWRFFCTKIGHYDYLKFQIQKQSLLKMPSLWLRFEYWMC